MTEHIIRGGGHVKLLNKLERKFGRYAIENLMLIILGGQALVFIADVFMDGFIYGWIALIWDYVKAGQIWRCVTFVFVPDSFTLLNFILGLYFYYMIGGALENEWGAFNFNCFYLLGVICCNVAAAITGYSSVVYIHQSMFFAFALLYPDYQVLLFYLIPIKVKWLALIDLGLFVWMIVTTSFPANLLPVVILLHYVVFCGGWLIDYIRPARVKQRAKTVSFKREAERIRREQASQPYRFKCAVCGRTDVSNPELEFRYCSRCAGYHCFCMDHINDHRHFTE